MALLPDAVEDFVNLTLPKFEKRKFVDISLDLQSYVSKRFINEKQIKYRGGSDVRFKVQTTNTGNARPTGLFSQDQTGVKDLTTQGIVPWRAVTTNWSYDIYEELFQSPEETIVDELMVREHSCYNDMCELMEQQLWSAPAASTDTETPMGIPFWVQKDTTTSGGFNGGNPSGFTAGAASIDSTAVTNWKNYAFGYTSVTPDDLIDRVKQAMYKTNFKAPHPHPELGYGSAQHMIFTTYKIRKAVERLAETRNDNLGNDVARYIDNVLIGGVPVEAVPYLDSNTTDDPIYGIDCRSLRPFVKTGADMRQTKKSAPLQRNVREVHYDTWYNYVCINRRLNWVGSK